MTTSAKVYVMDAGGGIVKLGYSINPQRRVYQVSVEADLAYETMLIDQAEKVERLAHRILALTGKHIEGELFEATVSQAIDAIDTAIRQHEGLELPLGGKLNKFHWKNNPKEWEVFSLRLDPKLKEKLQSLADADRRSLTNYVEVLLQIHVEEATKGRRK